MWETVLKLYWKEENNLPKLVVSFRYRIKFRNSDMQLINNFASNFISSEKRHFLYIITIFVNKNNN